MEEQAGVRWDGIRYQILKDRLKNEAREAMFGKIRPLVNVVHQGYRFVAAGSRLICEKKEKLQTVPNLLMRYLPAVIGADWGNAEIKKPYDQRHPIMKWYDDMCYFQAKQKKTESGLYEMVPNGPTFHYLLLADDLFCLEDNGAYQEAILRRLRHPDQFQGARYEVFAAASCIRAGYKIVYEDETDVAQKHDEFVAQFFRE